VRDVGGVHGDRQPASHSGATQVPSAAQPKTFACAGQVCGVHGWAQVLGLAGSPPQTVPEGQGTPPPQVTVRGLPQRSVVVSEPQVAWAAAHSSASVCAVHGWTQALASQTWPARHLPQLSGRPQPSSAMTPQLPAPHCLVGAQLASGRTAPASARSPGGATSSGRTISSQEEAQGSARAQRMAAAAALRPVVMERPPHGLASCCALTRESRRRA